MYIDRQDLIAAPGATATLERSYTALGELLAKAEGFVGQTLLHSYAYPNKYTLFTRWQDIESAWAFSASDQLATFLKGMPAGLFTRSRYEGFDTVIDVSSDSLGPDNAKVVQFADWELSSIAKAQAYEASRRELFALQKEHVEGFVSAQLQRSSGVPTKYLMVIQFTSREATGGGGRIPQIRDFVAANPAANFANTSPAIEFYAVVPQA